MVEKAEQIFRDFETDGVPASGKHKPRKSDIRIWGRWLEDNIKAGYTNGGLIFDTKANLNLSLAHDANASAWVVADGANNGIYRKIGASGTGSWSKIADLPYSVIYAQNAGTGTADAVEATSAVPISTSPHAQLISVPFTDPNTGAMTLSINGETPRPLVTNTGAAIPAGYITAGMSVLVQIDSDGNYRLFSYGDASAIQAAVEALVADVEDAADRAEAAAAGVEYPVSYAPQSLTEPQKAQARENIGVDYLTVADRTALKALDTSTTTAAYLTEKGREGQYFLRDASDYAAEIAATNGQGYFIVSDDDPTKVWAAPLHTEIILTELGADPTASGWSDAALHAAFGLSKTRGYLPIIIPPGRYNFQDTYDDLGPVVLQGAEQGSGGGVVPYHSVDLRHYSNDDFLIMTGGDEPAGGTGSRIENVLVQKASGYTGGAAFQLVSQDDAHRPGEHKFRNILVAANGTGRWGYGIIIDGRNTDTPGGRGVRTVTFDNVRLTRILTDYKYLWVRQGTHIKGQVALEPAGDSGINGMTLDDFWDNIDLELRYGHVKVNHVASGSEAPHLNLRGRIQSLDINHSGIIGAFIGTCSDGITSQAQGFKIVSDKADSLYIYQNATSSNLTGDGTTVHVPFNTEGWDANSNGDSLDRYLVRCAGEHEVTGTVTLTGIDTSHTDGVVRVRHLRSGSVIEEWPYLINPAAMRNAANANSVSLPFSVRMKCDEGDYVRVFMGVGGGTKTVGVSGSSTVRRTFLQGRLL